MTNIFKFWCSHCNWKPSADCGMHEIQKAPNGDHLCPACGNTLSRMPTHAKPSVDHLKHLGSKITTYDQEPGSPYVLEIFETPSRDQYTVTLETDEFTSLCPKTGQPDFGSININYVPDSRCLESKSLKLYLFSYRNYRGFMEEIINKIADDLYMVLKPRSIHVVGSFNARGGITITVRAFRWRNHPISS